MEIIIGLIIVVVAGLLWHANSKDRAETKSKSSDEVAPYKVEAPVAQAEVPAAPVVVETAPVVQPAEEKPAPVKKPRVGQRAAASAKAADKAVKKAKAPAKAKAAPKKKTA